MQKLVWWLSWAGLAVVMATPSKAHAAPAAVMESYAGERPGDAGALLAPVYAELARAGYASAPQLERLTRERLSRPGDIGAWAAANELTERGYQAWLGGRIDEAADTLVQAVKMLRANPAAFATEAERRKQWMKALVILALAENRLGKASRAAATMAEVVRSFPDIPLDRRLFGPEAANLYRSVERDVRTMRPGRLSIHIDDPTAAVFVNERFIGAGKPFDDEVAPGTYRVYAQRGAQLGRLHLIEVPPGGNATLAIDWALDSSLRTSGYVGFSFEDEETRANVENEKAVAVARWLGVSGLVVLGIRDYAGKRAIIGSVVSLDTGRSLRTAAVAISPTLPNDETLRGLARFLTGGDPVPGLILPGDLEAALSPAIRKNESVRSRPSRAWALGTLLGGVALVGTGAWLLHIDGPILDSNGDHTPDQYETKVPGFVSIGAGAALIGAGVYLWVARGSGERTARVAALPTRAGWVVALGGAF